MPFKAKLSVVAVSSLGTAMRASLTHPPSIAAAISIAAVRPTFMTLPLVLVA
jgi:hypothetical protein